MPRPRKCPRLADAEVEATALTYWRRIRSVFCKRAKNFRYGRLQFLGRMHQTANPYPTAPQHPDCTRFDFWLPTHEAPGTGLALGVAIDLKTRGRGVKQAKNDWVTEHTGIGCCINWRRGGRSLPKATPRSHFSLNSGSHVPSCAQLRPLYSSCKVWPEVQW